MKKTMKAFILGALALGAVSSQAVPTLDIDVLQRNWRVWITVDPDHDGESLDHVLVDSRVDRHQIFFAEEGGSTYAGFLDIWDFLNPGTHTISFVYESGLTASDSYTIAEPTGDRPATFLPDGGATALMLGIGALGMAAARRHFSGV